MTIRPARSEDARNIASFWGPLARDTTITFSTEEKPAKSIEAMIENRGPSFVVAEIEDKVVGFATFGPFRSGPGYVHTAELTIILEERARGQGIARALMHALEDAARAADIHVLVAGISGDNPDAIGFHQALGFAETGRMPQVGRKFGRWLDLVLMQKTV